MISKLIRTGVLLVASLLLLHPANGQGVEQSAVQGFPTSMSKTSFEAASASRLDFSDLSREIAVEAPTQQGFSAAGFASALIEVLASRNAVAPDGLPSSPLDAYLRPPQNDSDDSGLFRQAKSFYDDATTIESDRAEVILDPLKMRWALRINLNRLLSN